MDLQDGSNETLADEIKEEILEKACLTTSHGIGPNKLVAKISNHL